MNQLIEQKTKQMEIWYKVFDFHDNVFISLWIFSVPFKCPHKIHSSPFMTFFYDNRCVPVQMNVLPTAARIHNI